MMERLCPSSLASSTVLGEKVMLSVVETLKEFRTMISGYPIAIYRDHLNWIHDKAF
jgi:hypothetical protein